MASLKPKKSAAKSRRLHKIVHDYWVRYLPPGHTVKGDGYSLHNAETTSESKANLVKARVERTLEIGLPYEAEDCFDWARLAEDFVEFKTGKTESEGTVRFYRGTLKLIMLHFGGLPASAWTRDEWLAYLVAGINGSRWSRPTCTRRATTMNQFVSWAIDQKGLQLDRNMAYRSLAEAGSRAGGYPNIKEDDKPTPMWPEFRMIATYLNENILAETQAGLPLALALMAGLRREELRKVKWSAITLDGVAPAIILARRAGKRGTRMVEIREPLLGILRQVPHGERTGLVCKHIAGIDANSSGPVRDALLRRVGVDPKGWHAYRHGFCYWLWAMRVDPDQIKDEMGHKNFTTTSIYMGARWPEKRRMGAEFFAEVLLPLGALHDMAAARSRKGARTG